MDDLKPGLKGELKRVVTEKDTASRYGSGLVDALATPALVALMEGASVAALHKYLNPNQTSVGVEVNIKHLAPTPVGMSVLAKAELVEVNGNRIRFRVEAWDDKEKVGEGTHLRAIIDAARFTERLKQKSGSHLS
jgi:predicted thioesterase